MTDGSKQGFLSAAAVALAMSSTIVGLPISADERHLQRSKVVVVSRKKQRFDPMDKKRKKTTRSWRSGLRRKRWPTSHARSMRRYEFAKSIESNAANKLTNWQLHQWQRACRDAGHRVDPGRWVWLADHIQVLSDMLRQSHKPMRKIERNPHP